MALRKLPLLLFFVGLVMTLAPAAFARHNDGYQRKARHYQKSDQKHGFKRSRDVSLRSRCEREEHRQRDRWRVGIILPTPIVIKIY